MQPIRYLQSWLEENAHDNRCIFASHDLRALFSKSSDSAFKVLLSRAVTAKILIRACRGIYVYKRIKPDGLTLFHIAALLRANEFNYISLESVLSAAGIISQIPMNWVSIMSSGCSNTISCGIFGTIEYIHTAKKPHLIMEHISYDNRCGLWRASIPLALKDMKATDRNDDLIDWVIANEFI